jgi:short-subunit dehydrogenase
VLSFLRNRRPGPSAITFAARGRNLALCARRADRLGALAAELESAHGITVITRNLDVNDHDQVFAVFKQLRNELRTQPMETLSETTVPT